ncbi:hypothetical protein ACJX0J_006444, partial [Zea mays]
MCRIYMFHEEEHSNLQLYKHLEHQIGKQDFRIWRGLTCLTWIHTMEKKFSPFNILNNKFIMTYIIGKRYLVILVLHATHIPGKQIDLLEEAHSLLGGTTGISFKWERLYIYALTSILNYKTFRCFTLYLGQYKYLCYIIIQKHIEETCVVALHYKFLDQRMDKIGLQKEVNQFNSIAQFSIVALYSPL